jgi:hypothetical protein
MSSWPRILAASFVTTAAAPAYAVSDQLFHWESEAVTSVTSPTGQRYLHHKDRSTNVALFIRRAKRDASGRTMPYFCAGTAS